MEQLTQIEWLKRRIADLQLPEGKRDHDTREKYLLQCGMPEASAAPVSAVRNLTREELMTLIAASGAVFADENPEAQWIADAENACPHCGGSGHKDDVTSHTALSPAPVSEPQCCMCGKKGLSTVEGDGGTECELSDGRWTCSQECWERAVDPQPVAFTAQVFLDSVSRGEIAKIGPQGTYEKEIPLYTAPPSTERMREALERLVNACESMADAANMGDEAIANARAVLADQKGGAA